jgi:hypothetical protein
MRKRSTVSANVRDNVDVNVRAKVWDTINEQKP